MLHGEEGHIEEGHNVSLSVINCPKAKVIDNMVSMVTKLDIPVITLLIRCFIVKRETCVPFLLSKCFGLFGH